MVKTFCYHGIRGFDWHQNRWPWMTVNGVMTLMLRYFTKFVYDIVVKMFTFVLSSPDSPWFCLKYWRYINDLLTYLLTYFLLLTRWPIKTLNQSSSVCLFCIQNTLYHSMLLLWYTMVAARFYYGATPFSMVWRWYAMVRHCYYWETKIAFHFMASFTTVSNGTACLISEMNRHY